MDVLSTTAATTQNDAHNRRLDIENYNRYDDTYDKLPVSDNYKRYHGVNRGGSNRISGGATKMNRYRNNFHRDYLLERETIDDGLLSGVFRVMGVDPDALTANISNFVAFLVKLVRI